MLELFKYNNPLVINQNYEKDQMQTINNDEKCFQPIAITNNYQVPMFTDTTTAM